MNSTDRQRRHDELWQKEVVDALARMLDVLHDISDGIQQVARAATLKPTEPAAPSGPDAPVLLSIEALAKMLGTTPSVVRGLRANGKGPTVTKFGRRIFFHRTDVDAWLREAREQPVTATRPWRDAYLPGRVGSTVPRSSEPTERPWCPGSHTEPMAASRYSGMAVCRVCRDDVLVNKDGRLRKHRPY